MSSKLKYFLQIRLRGNFFIPNDFIELKKAYGFELPDWAEQNFDQIVSSLGWGFYFDYRLPEMAKLTAG